MFKMYFGIISNDCYPEEAHTSNIYFFKPSLKQLYDHFGEPEDMLGLYHNWCVQVQQITNLQKIDNISRIEFSENGYSDEDYIIGGEGYLYDEHQGNLQSELDHKKEKKLCEI